MKAVRLEPAATRSLVKHSTTEPLPSGPEASNMAYMGCDTRKPAFEVLDLVRLNSAFSATESSCNIIATSTIIL